MHRARRGGWATADRPPGERRLRIGFGSLCLGVEVRFCRVCLEAGVGEERLLFREENNDAVAAGERASETPGLLNRERKESSQHLSFVPVVSGPSPAPCCLSAGAAMAGEENLSWVDALSRPPRKSCIGSQKQQAHQTSGSVLSPIRNERAGVCGRVGVPLFASMGFFSSLLPIPTDPSFVTHERNISGISAPRLFHCSAPSCRLAPPTAHHLSSTPAVGVANIAKPRG